MSSGAKRRFDVSLRILCEMQPQQWKRKIGYRCLKLDFLLFVCFSVPLIPVKHGKQETSQLIEIEYQFFLKKRKALRPKLK